jgi:hypothetical protein
MTGTSSRQTMSTSEPHSSRVPPIDRDAESLTMSLQRPTTYAAEKFRRFGYVPLWYFPELGLPGSRQRQRVQWRPLRCHQNQRQLPLPPWLIPAGWPESYAKVLFTFFWQIENHEDKGIAGGKETLLLYQARARKAWHDELKLPISSISPSSMTRR